MTKMKRFITDKHGTVVVFQAPNIPLILWAVAFSLSRVVSENYWTGAFSKLSTLFIAIWAYLEVTSGESLFQRTLGVIVAAGILYGIFF